MNNNQTTSAPATADEAYTKSFLPAVHRIGRTTMILALLLSLLPAVYFYFVKGYQLPMSLYASATIMMVTMMGGGWISEPTAYWPILGSAGAYMSYLSGNVSGMRFPVASTVQKNFKANINTPRGQIVTIVGIAASVVFALVILLIIILAGEWVLGILPAVILAAFDFVVPSIISGMTVMNLDGEKGFLKTLKSALPYIAVSLAVYLLTTYVFTKINELGIGMLLAIGLSILMGYGFYRRDLKKLEAEEASAEAKND